ncbi:Copper homeostasis protein CutC [Nymphon striatum]|nr:Copper homeostasis protein CutC [Nymphon striatum]
MLVEVCSNSLQSAINAEKAGADRIELCSELAVGGITPSYGLLKAVREKITIPVRVLIRPRSGDFTYSDDEFEIIKTNIAVCKELGFQGVVSGALQSDFTLDVDRTKELVDATKGLHFTFHRAFDWVKHPKETLEILEDIGVDTILTSGQQKKALDGIDLLSELNESSSNIIVMPGSGINSENAHMFKEKGFKAIHFSAVQMQQKLQENPMVGMNSANMLSDDFLPISHFETIQKIVRAVK